jgi:hypothetical protein
MNRKPIVMTAQMELKTRFISWPPFQLGSDFTTQAPSFSKYVPRPCRIRRTID